MLRAIVLVILIDVSPELSAVSASGFCTAPESCMVAIARTQDGRVQEALKRIPDIGAKLLALRSYLRAGSGLAQRWSWTESQIEAFAGSMHEQQITAAIASVRREFELASPGYTLWVNTQVRSLDRQLQAWNTNDSVAAAASEFETSARFTIQQQASDPRGINVQDFADFIRNHKPQPSPNLAAPGLSRHGQMNAVDFHVLRGSELVADTDSATVTSVWIAQGWEQKLRSAVVASGSPFVGPLQEPNEPWHYVYEPMPEMPLE